MTADPAALQALIASETAHSTAESVARCTRALRERYGPGTIGILFYGAGLRGNDPAAMLDFYVIVDDMRAALNSTRAAWAAELLPPNVYFVEVADAARTIRTKVAVISWRSFKSGTTGFTPQIWGRFAQPVSIAYARDDRVRAQLVAALTTSVETFMARTLPLMPARFTATELWACGLAACYAAELRPERYTQAADLVKRDPDRYGAMTRAVLGPPDSDGQYRRPPGLPAHAARTIWWLRCRWGKTLNMLRLMKAAFTFAGGLDYAVAKIARHTGVVVTISDRDRRRPLLAGIRLFLEARRRGGVK